LLTVIPGAQSSSGIRTAIGSATSLTLEDATNIKSQLSNQDISDVSPEYSSRSQVTAGRTNTNTQITGVEPQYATIHKVNMESGNFITDQDVRGITRVAVLGPQTATNLFDTSNPIGQNIRIRGQNLKIIGVTQSKGGTGFNNPDDAIYVPLPTAQKVLFGSNYLSTISVETKSKEVATAAQNEVGYLLLSRHKLTDPASADFTIFSQQDILNTAAQVTGIFTTLLGGIAAISLLVGGIGIMNIMLVTVTERTREIGLRKALGAQKKIIITQFLIETIILTLTGGAIGMGLGITISFLLSKAIQIPFTISPQAIALAVGVSGIIGIIFGAYPARKAANLEPIEALRYE
jgi:putative ABC transport system permease protein